jgi:hypothetical protein
VFEAATKRQKEIWANGIQLPRKSKGTFITDIPRISGILLQLSARKQSRVESCNQTSE